MYIFTILTSKGNLIEKKLSRFLSLIIYFRISDLRRKNNLDTHFLTYKLQPHDANNMYLNQLRGNKIQIKYKYFANSLFFKKKKV